MAGETVLEKKAKDFHELNLLIRWIFFIGLSFIVSFALVFYFLEFEVFYKKALVYSVITRTILFLITVFIVLFIIHKINITLSNRINYKYLLRFDYREELGAYKESRARFNSFPDKKHYPVLLLHGFSTSPQDFDVLIKHLEKNQITYYAPLLSGFGLDNTTQLSKVSRNDWKRDALNAFDLLASISEKVNIIGYSMGTILADFICTKRDNVNRVILASPAFYTSEHYDTHKKILSNDYSYFIFNLFIPYLPKALDKEKGYVGDIVDSKRAAKNFQYLTAPVSSVRELFLMQDEYDISGLKKAKELVIFYAEKDKLIHIQKLQDRLDSAAIPYTLQAFYKSGHNLYFDLEADEVSKYTLPILLKPGDFDPA